MWTLYKKGNAWCRRPRQERRDLQRNRQTCTPYWGDSPPGPALLGEALGFVGQEVSGKWADGRSRQERKKWDRGYKEREEA